MLPPVQAPATPDPRAAQSTGVSALPSLSGIFTGTVDDLRRLPSRDTLTWLSIGAVASAVAYRGDDRVSRAFSGSNRLDGAFESGSTIGGLSVQLGGAFATYAAGRLTKSPRVATIGADLVRAQLVSQAVTHAVKFSVRRTRPDGGSFSFPSGHTSTTFASATVLQRHLGWKAGIPAYAVAAYVAASRVHDARHFLSDVAFGAAIGIVSARTVTVGRGDTRFAVTPMAAPGGGGVALTWMGNREMR